MFEKLKYRSEPPAHNPKFFANNHSQTIISEVSYNDWHSLHDCIILLGIIAEEQSNKGSSFFDSVDTLCAELYADLFFDPTKPEPDNRGVNNHE